MQLSHSCKLKVIANYHAHTRPLNVHALKMF